MPQPLRQLTDEPAGYTAGRQNRRTRSMDEHPDGFAKLPLAVMRQHDLSMGARVCYAALRYYAREEGHCFPGIETLAGDLGVSERQIQLYIKELAAAGLITVEVAHGRGKRNVYTLVGIASGPCEKVKDTSGLSEEKVKNTSSEKVKNTSPPIRKTRSNRLDITSANAEGATVPAERDQRPAPTPAQKQPPPPRQEQPQYRVFLALCAAAGSTPADMEGHKGTACANAAKALKLLTARYADEAHADPAGDAEADLCAMATWKVLDYRRQNRHRRGLPPALVWMAYQDMAAWREAGCPGRPAAVQANGHTQGYDFFADKGVDELLAARRAKEALRKPQPGDWKQ